MINYLDRNPVRYTTDIENPQAKDY